MPSIRSFSWCRNVFLDYGQELQSRGEYVTDMLKAKHRQGEADSGCEKAAPLGLVWATGVGVHPGVGMGC
jgi:hypothetical protein